MEIKNLTKGAADGATGLMKNELVEMDSEGQSAVRRQSQVSAFVTIKNGPIELNGPNTTHQRQEDGLVYFGTGEAKLYQLIGYPWDGPFYGSVPNTQIIGTDNSQTTRRGKVGKMTAGAVIGTFLLPRIGTVVGVAVGAEGKRKSTT